MKRTTAVFSFSMFATGISGAAAAGYSVTLCDPVSAGGTQLRTGDYRIEMQSDKAMFRSRGAMVAQAPATMGASEKKYIYAALSSTGLKQSEIGPADTG
ncbi:MAG: hypothetical protein M3N93_00535 [Acidobacteriota bacterium]|nr:hypothetical protein [Acidobacteriota bacterium]